MNANNYSVLTDTPNITDQFVNDLYEMSQGSFSVDVITEAKKCILDYLGVSFAGAKMISKKSNWFLDFINVSAFDSTVIGLKRKASVQNAALLNGMNAHAAELDDGERFGMFHPGAPILSALLPLAELKKISGGDLLKGVIVGYEASIRLAGTLQPAMKDHGYHGTGICGTVGAAVGIAVALNFSKQQMKDALSSATTSASGLLKVIKDVSELKPYNAGNAAQSGLMAAMIALAGFKGPRDVLGGSLGFLSVMSSKFDVSRLEFKKGDVVGILKIYRKPFAACRHCHSAIEAAINLKAANEINIDEVESVKVKTYFWAVGGHEHTEIHGVSSAKMSTPYSVAVALVTGEAGINEFTNELLTDDKIKSLTKKISVETDEALTQLVPNKRAAIVEIVMNDGRMYSERVDLPKGEPENPISGEELEDKFISLALYSGISREQSNHIIDSVWNIEHKLVDLYKFL